MDKTFFLRKEKKQPNQIVIVKLMLFVSEWYSMVVLPKPGELLAPYALNEADVPMSGVGYVLR